MRALTTTAAVLAFCLAGFGAQAQTRIAIDCPGGAPCDDFVISGVVDSVGGARLPWVATLVLPAGICMSALVNRSTAPVHMTVVDPNGKRADPDVGSAKRVVNPTTEGWYTIQVDSQPPTNERIFRLAISLLPTTACDPTPTE